MEKTVKEKNLWNRNSGPCALDLATRGRDKIAGRGNETVRATRLLGVLDNEPGVDVVK
jgi:hypothetical protein